jgi:RNA polymerase sigma factor (sigma-70 family)
LESFETLQKQYESMIYKVIQSLNIYKNADEFFQTGLIALWEAQERFNPKKGTFSAFAFSYIRGRLLDDLKKTHKDEERNVHPEEEFWYLLEDEHSVSMTSETEWILSYCKSMTEQQKKWVLHTCVNRLTPTEIARLENVSLSAVKKWRKGAIERLKGRIKRIDLIN